MIIVNRLGKNILISTRNNEFNTVFSKEKYDELIKISEDSETIKTAKELAELVSKVEAICEDDYSNKIESFCSDIAVQPITNKFYLVLDSKATDIEIPEILVERIKYSIEKGISVDPLIKCFKRLLKGLFDRGVYGAERADFIERFCDYISMTYVRPDKYNELMENDNLSHEIAKELATTYEIKITQEGLLCGMKCVTEVEHKFIPGEDGNPQKVNRYTKTFNADTGVITGDDREDISAEERLFIPYLQGYNGDEFSCESLTMGSTIGHFVRIGAKHALSSWDKVNCDSNKDCVKGLHIGGLSYISGWSGHIMTCLVDPAHIGAICRYNGSYAMRVLEYFVDGSMTALNHSIYHSSMYGKLCDDKWLEISKNIIGGLEVVNQGLEEEKVIISNL